MAGAEQVGSSWLQELDLDLWLAFSWRGGNSKGLCALPTPVTGGWALLGRRQLAVVLSTKWNKGRRGETRKRDMDKNERGAVTVDGLFGWAPSDLGRVSWWEGWVG